MEVVKQIDAKGQGRWIGNGGPRTKSLHRPTRGSDSANFWVVIHSPESRSRQPSKPNRSQGHTCETLSCRHVAILKTELAIERSTHPTFSIWI